MFIGTRLQRRADIVLSFLPTESNRNPQSVSVSVPASDGAHCELNVATSPKPEPFAFALPLVEPSNAVRVPYKASLREAVSLFPNARKSQEFKTPRSEEERRRRQSVRCMACIGLLAWLLWYFDRAIPANHAPALGTKVVRHYASPHPICDPCPVSRVRRALSSPPKSNLLLSFVVLR